MSLLAQKQILLAVGRLPRDDGSTIQENLDRFTGGKKGSHARVIVGDGDLGGGGEWGDGNRVGLVGAFDHLQCLC